MRPAARAGRAVVPSLAVLLVAGCAATGVQGEADEAAAAFADTTLLRSLQEAAQVAPPDRRVAAVTDRLQEPDEEVLVTHPDASWVVGAVSGSEIGVTAYYYWEDKSFSASQAWGVACRRYTVSREVSVVPVECPETTPARPGRGVVGWDYR